ncbi:MAG: hypothetical protein UDF83_00230 [Collinsella stercoris]|nr:hypothetical protein [Collinsella stercoris]
MDASIVPLRAGGRRWGEWRWGGRSAHGDVLPIALAFMVLMAVLGMAGAVLL